MEQFELSQRKADMDKISEDSNEDEEEKEVTKGS
jgi:hypothetical protein